MFDLRSWAVVSFVGILAIGGGMGCSEDADPSAPSAGAAGSSAAAAGAGGSSGGGNVGGAGQAAVPIGPEVTLTYGDASVTVDVGKLAIQTYKDEPVIPLSAIWAAGNLGKPAAELTFDFEADDGFRPTTKPKCPTPVAGADLEKGYLLPATRSLVWDDALGFPGCYSVKGLKTIIALDP